jgi:hypothetical protein
MPQEEESRMEICEPILAEENQPQINADDTNRKISEHCNRRETSYLCRSSVAFYGVEV